MEDTGSPLSVEGVSLLASFVIRPPRARYSHRDLPAKQFQPNNSRPVTVTRTDLQLVNARGLTLECSHYIPSSSASGSQSPVAMPAVVYLHGNGSCRVEAELLFDHTLAYGMSVFSFDFSGSGKSGGEYISLGVFEKYDVETVVEYLSSCPHVSSIALWGHSMGAATAAMYAGFVDPSALGDRVSPPSSSSASPRTPKSSLIRGRSKLSIGRNPRKLASFESRGSGVSNNTVSPSLHPDAPQSLVAEGKKEVSTRVSALVLDSAFASFDELANAMVQTMPLPAAVPRRLVLSVGVRAVRKAVRDKAGFDVYDIDPLSAAKRIRPSLATLMLQGSEDEIVHLAHAQLLYEAQSGRDVELVVMQGIDHDAPRPSFAIEHAFILLQRTLFDGHGKLSLRYCHALKLRGNDCMVLGHFDDAVFLYTDALQSLVEQELGERGLNWLDASNSTPPLGTCAEGAADGVAGQLESRSSENFQSAASGETIDSDVCHLWPESEDDSLPRSSIAGSPNSNLPKKRFSVRVGDLLAGKNHRVSRSAADPQGHDGVSLSGRDVEPRLASERLLHSSARSSGQEVGKVNSSGTDRWRKARAGFPGRNLLRSGDAVDNQSGSRGHSGVGPSKKSVRNATIAETISVEFVIRKYGLSGERKDVALALLGNRSLAHLRTKKCEKALSDAEFALELDKQWVRGYQRKAAALKALNRIEDARVSVLAGLRIAPVNATLLTMEAEFEDEALAAALKASMEEPRPVSPRTSHSSTNQEDGCPVNTSATVSEFVNPADTGSPETMSSAASAHS